MNSRVSVRLCALAAALVVGACKSDPTADLAGQPQTVFINPGTLFLNEGDSATVTVKILDEAGTPLQGQVQAVSTAPTIASVALATGVQPDPTRTTSVFRITALLRGPAYARVTGLGLADSARINVLPAPFVFDGTLSSATPKGGDTLTLSASGAFRFDPTADTVTFGGGVAGTMIANSATQIKVLVPFSSADSLHIAGTVLPYVPGKTFTVPSSQVVTQTGDFWAGDSSWQTAPNITTILPAPGDTSRMTIGTTPVDNSAVCPEAALGFGSTGPCMMFELVLPHDTVLNFKVDWTGGALAPDVDIYACSDSTVANFGTACFEDGGAGATASKPQATGDHQYPAGTHWFVAEIFDNSSGVSPNYFVTINAKAITTLSTSANPTTAVVGDTLNDSATLGGGTGVLSGTITFRLFTPSQSTCAGTPAYTQTVNVTGAGTYTTSPGFKSTAAGTWRWRATYSGDAKNQGRSTTCSAEPVTVS